MLNVGKPEVLLIIGVVVTPVAGVSVGNTVVSSTFTVV